MELLQKKCVPCEAGVPPLREEESNKLLLQAANWQLIEKQNH